MPIELRLKWTAEDYQVAYDELYRAVLGEGERAPQSMAQKITDAATKLVA